MGLFENVKKESVSNLAIRPAIVIDGNGTVRNAVGELRNAHLGCAITVDADGKPQGMFTEAMLRSMIARDPALIDSPIREHLATTFPWIKESDPIQLVLDAMETNNTRFVVVVDDAGAVVGITGQKGLMEYVAEHFPGQAHVQRLDAKSYPEQREGA